MSNLPAGVTNHEIDALCERAYRSDRLFECSRCLQGIHDYTEVSHYRVNGKDVCGECVHSCAGGCGMLDDDTFPAKVIEIRFREWANDGKLSDAMCPICAANEILGGMLGERNFDFNDFPGEWGKDAIAQLLAKAFPLPVRWPHEAPIVRDRRA